MPGTGARPLRADAERNRQRILQAAARLFARDGLEASLDEIARAARVGVGTVYRRFPDREQLLQALFEDRLEALIGLAETADAAADPAEGLREFAESMVEQHVADRGLKELLFAQAECADRMGGTRERIAPLLVGLLRRAQQAGSLRPDVGIADVMMAVFMAGSVGALTVESQPEQWRRQFAMLWDGLRRSDGPSGLPSDPLSLEELTAAFNQGQSLQRRGTA